MALTIGVMGAGSIGCYVGGRLLARGRDVLFIGRERVKAELTAHDLRLTDIGGAVEVVAKEKVRVETDVAMLADRDVILVCVKSGQTEEAGRALAQVVRKDALVVSMQNGVRNAETLRQVMPGKIVLGGIVGFNVVSKDGGTFQRGTTGPLAIEMPGDATGDAHDVAARVRALGAALTESGFEMELPTDIRSKQWSKLMMNLNNAVSALSGAPTPQLIFTPGYRRVLRALIGEALVVLDAAKIRPAKLGAIPVRYFPTILGLPTAVLRVVTRAQLQMDPEARSSMWEDLTRGRTTEIDFLNGEIVALAKTCGASAPLNERIVEMVHAAEKEKKGSPGLSPDALWSALHEEEEPRRAS